MSRDEILALQQSLNQSGFAQQTLGEPLTEDGIYGRNTDRAYRAWLDRDESVPTVAPEPAKAWWQSRAILGLLASMLAMIAGRFGWEVNDGQITDLLLKIVEIGGLALAAWGTIRRNAPIDSTLVARVGDRDFRLPVQPNGKTNVDPRGVFRDY